MPSDKNRVNVVLSDDQDALLTRLSGIQGRSKSAIMRELLELARPTLEQMLATFEELQAITAKSKQEFAGDLSKAQQASAAWALRAVQDAERMLREVQDEAEAYKSQLQLEMAEEGTGARSATGPKTPPSNRGVRTHQHSARRGKGRG